MIRIPAGFLSKESGTASVPFALLAAGASIIAMGVVMLFGAKIGLDCGIHDALRHVQVFRLAWDASNVQCISRLQQNERYYVSDPASSEDNVMSTIGALLACVKHVSTVG